MNQNLETFKKPIFLLFGLIKIKEKLWDERKVCSNDSSHYEYKTMNNDDDYDGY